MMSNADRQRQFVPLFLFAVVMDTLAAFAAASRDEVLSHLAMLWTGPLDNIVFGLVGCQALLYLLDPSGAKTLDDKGNATILGTGKLFLADPDMQRGLATRFLKGSHASLLFLAGGLTVALLSSLVLPPALGAGLAEVTHRHLSSLLPIAMVVGGGVAFLQSAEGRREYGAACLLGTAVVVAVAVKQGRIENYLYHMVANLESLYAWCLTLSWSAFFVDRKAAPEVTPTQA